MNKFDLEERTQTLGTGVIGLCRKLNKNNELRIISNQLLRCGTSIGANYREANGAVSGKDFKNKIYICKKETKESIYWLNLVIRSTGEFAAEAEVLKMECEQLEKIFGKITTTISKKYQKN